MGARIARRALGAALLACCALSSGCGEKHDEPAPAPTVQPQPAPKPAPKPAVQAEREPEPQLLPKTAKTVIREALHALESEDRQARREAVEALLEQGFPLTNIVHLAFRASQWDKDVGLLADLLSDRTEEVFPLVLRRIGHSAPVHRGKLCRALRYPRENTHPAFAILIMRALLEEYPVARSAAQHAVRTLSPRGAEILAIHELLSGTPRGEPVTVLLPSALVGPCPDPGFAKALEAVCELELRRFPGNDSYSVARVLASLGGPDATERIRALLEEEQLSPETALSVLSGPEPWVMVRFNLETGRDTEDSLRALAGMGRSGAELAGLVLPYLERRSTRKQACRTLWRMGVRDETVQRAVFLLWWEHRVPHTPDDETSAEVATLMQLLRPEGATIDVIARRLAYVATDVSTQSTLLSFLGWCAPGERTRARRLIMEKLATKPGRAVHRRAQENLLLLQASEEEMAEHVKRAVRESEWLR